MQATYDEYGRVLTSTDADNRTTTTSYTPATGAEPTSEIVTDPMGLVTTTDLRPGPRPAADGHQPGRLGHLGDLRRARPADRGLEARPPAGQAPADETFSYDVSATPRRR